eukprot:CAMPEP_0198215308 /NCGR_PEP_ID=MMETSP1445-20131203/48774_1 /TAXON_ID=36898 /ORGANISM="Pyramimonas sp., Strain CCMP2087" /LENGTH=43 /DNA_ID= /DNA_START= /DNA_END= /DNA_ORIENTATION=
MALARNPRALALTVKALTVKDMSRAAQTARYGGGQAGGAHSMS